MPKQDIGAKILESIFNNLHVQMLSDQDILQIKLSLYNALKREIEGLR